MEEHGKEGCTSSPKSNISYFFCKIWKFYLKWCIILLLLDSHHKFTFIRIFSNSTSNHDSCSWHKFWAWNQKGTGALFFFISNRNFLFYGVGLSSYWWLITSNITTLNHNSVHW
jgi:hypothetical protein